MNDFRKYFVDFLTRWYFSSDWLVLTYIFISVSNVDLPLVFIVTLGLELFRLAMTGSLNAGHLDQLQVEVSDGPIL